MLGTSTVASGALFTSAGCDAFTWKPRKPSECNHTTSGNWADRGEPARRHRSARACARSRSRQRLFPGECVQAESRSGTHNAIKPLPVPPALSPSPSPPRHACSIGTPHHIFLVNQTLHGLDALHGIRHLGVAFELGNHEHSQPVVVNGWTVSLRSHRLTAFSDTYDIFRKFYLVYQYNNQLVQSRLQLLSL